MLTYRHGARQDDAELVGRMRAGDADAFAEIVRRYEPRLLGFARRMLAGRSEYAEDVVQEALMRASLGLRRDAREILLAPWLYALTRNCCLDELSRVRGAVTLDLDETAVEQILVDHRSPDVVAEGRAGFREMLDAIATLPSEQRHALLRREVDGASYAQVADELRVSTQACRALVHRARRSLIAYRQAAATDVCATAQADLISAHRIGRRASHATHRHLAVCSSCRAYRRRLKTLRKTLHAMHPGPLLIHGAILIWLRSVSSKLSGLASRVAHGNHHARTNGTAHRLGRHLTTLNAHAGGNPGRFSQIAGAGAVGVKTALGAAGVLGALGAATVGGIVVLRAGDRSPVKVESAALPGRTVHTGAPLPAGTAIVAKAVRLRDRRATVTLACPGGERVADLLPPATAGISVGYSAGTVPGASARAQVSMLAQTGSAERSVVVAILCRRLQPDGAFLPRLGGDAAQVSPTQPACATHFLLDRPDGLPDGSVSRGEPLLVLADRHGWRKVRTQFGKTGWLSQRDTCGSAATRR